MSSTGRGKRLGGTEDFYETPAWCVQRLLARFEPPGERGGPWLEPAAGNGAIIKAVNERYGVSWQAIELRKECRSALYEIVPERTFVTVGDFLTMEKFAYYPDIVITNPPYNLAEDFIRRSAKLFPTSMQIFLLRLNFLASQKRQPWLSAWVPDVYVLPRRPAFKNGRTDSCEYAWFVWPSAEPRRYGKVEILDL